MYAAIRRYEGVEQPGEVARRAREGFLPLIQEMPGFVSYSVVDAGDGVVASISIFETSQDAEASTIRAAEWVRDNLAELVPNPPQVTSGELLVHESRVAAIH